MSLANQQLTPTKFIQTLTIIYMSLLLGILTFGGFVLFQFSNGLVPELDTNDTLLFVYPILVIGAMYGSQILFKRLITSVKNNTDLRSKLIRYQIASVVKFAIIEE